jgi:fumarate reductase subunit D
VAGGLSEFLTSFGMLAVVVCEVYGVILLVGTLSKERFSRTLLALVSIGCGTFFVIGLGALVAWFMRARAPL